MRSPVRAWARASVAPQSSPYSCRPLGTMVPMSSENLPSRSWHIEVALLAVVALRPLPSQEDVAGLLDQALAHHHPLPLGGVRGLVPGIRAEHGLFRLLDLEEQRVCIIAAEHQDDPAAGAHAADADDLARH